MLFDLLLGTFHWAVIEPSVGALFGLILIPLALPFRFFRATSTPVIAVGLPGLVCFASGLYLYWQHDLADMEHIQHLIFEYWIAGLLASIFYLRRDTRHWATGTSTHAVSILQSVSLVPMVLIALFAGLRFVSPAFTDEKARIYSWPFGVKVIIAFIFFGFASSAVQQLLYWPSTMALSAAGRFIENARRKDTDRES